MVSTGNASWIVKRSYRSGETGSWEDGMVRISQNFVTRHDRIYFYYGGVNGPHTGRKFKQVERTAQIHARLGDIAT